MTAFKTLLQYKSNNYYLINSVLIAIILACFVLYLDYFMKEMGPFSEIFANLESMNRAVTNALVESAKVCSIYCFSS